MMAQALWKKLAHRKIKEVEETIERSLQLKSLLRHLLQSHCASLQACVERLRRGFKCINPGARVVDGTASWPQLQPGHATSPSCRVPPVA